MYALRRVFLAFGWPVIMDMMNSAARVCFCTLYSIILFYFSFIVCCYTVPQINMIYFHSFIYTARCTFRYPSKQILFFYVVIFFSSLYLSLYYYFCSCLDFFFRRCMCCWKAQALGKDLPGLYTELYSLLCDTGKIISTLRLRFTLSEWE